MKEAEDAHRPRRPGADAHLILDRDGVLNREAPQGWITEPSDWKWEEGAEAALALVAARNIRLSIVTNQSCIGRGLTTFGRVDRVHDVVRDACSRLGMDPRNGPHIRVCPHVPGAGCPCRKPQPGMVLDAMADADVPADRTVLFGDDRRDLEAGRSAGIAVALIATGKGRATAADVEPAIEVHTTLRDAVRRWLDTLDAW